MDPTENFDVDDNDVAYVGENDDDEVIDINTDDAAGLMSEDLDEMGLKDADDDDDDEVKMAAGDEQRDDALTVFSKHTSSVFCVAVDPKTSTLAVTGGEDDLAYVWKLASGDVLLKCTGHKDSVTCVGFSHDSTMVATGDMSGLVKVWRLDTCQEIWSYETDELEWLQWHGSSHVLLAGTQTGDMWMWQIPSGTCKTFAGHGSRCTSGRILNDGKRACAGYGDGTVRLWDLKTGSAVFSLSAGKTGHEGEVTCIDCSSNDKVLMTGSTDVTALLINVGTGKVVTRFTCGFADAKTSLSEGAEGDVDSVEAVGFSSSHGYVATATHYGVLTVWDSGAFAQRHQCKHDAGIIRLRWDLTTPVVYTCTEDGLVCSWDARSGSRVSTWYGHMDHVLDMDLSRDGLYIVTASDDHTARVFSVHPSTQLS
jgi:ribosome assembly protein SQT1